MSSLVTIHNVQIEQLTYRNQPVVTFEMIARVHGVSIKNVQKSFDRHQDRFKEGTHAYRIDFTEANKLLPGVEVSRNGLRLFTKKGYLLLVKPMKDDKAWEVQERMIDEYFAMEEALQTLSVPTTHGDMLVQMAEAYRQLEAQQAATQAALIANQQQTIEALTAAHQAKNNTETIIDLYRMTLEQFVGVQGLLHIIPPESFQSASQWLKAYCIQCGWDAPGLPVQGRSWATEKGYPIEALMRYVEYLRKRPQQIALVSRIQKG